MPLLAYADLGVWHRRLTRCLEYVETQSREEFIGHAVARYAYLLCSLCASNAVVSLKWPRCDELFLPFVEWRQYAAELT